jgi:Flp pilus assembly pilin Flp
MFSRFETDRSGSTAIEFAVIGALITVIVVVTVMKFIYGS